MKAPFLEMFVTLVLILGARPLEAQVTYNGNGRVYSALLRAAYEGLKRAAAVVSPSRIITLADGGGDGGGGGDGSGGGGGDGSSSGDGSGAGDGNGDASDATDGVSADTATADPSAPDAQTSPTDPESIPTNDPSMSLRGGVPEGSVSSTGFGGVIVPPGAQPFLPLPSGGASQDVAIHAVIISGAQSPWSAISKAPGVRNVTLMGGLVALGKVPRPGEAAPGGTPPTFLKVIPDPKLLDGSIIPPVVPNIIDVRIVGYSVTADMPTETPAK